MDNDKNNKIIKSPYYSLEKLSEDSSLIKRGLRDLSIWPKIEELFAKLKTLYKAGKIQECIDVAEEILKTDANHFFTLCYYGRSLYLVERYAESLKIFDRCLEEEKQYYFLWSFIGDVYYKMGEYVEAIKNYDESLKLEMMEFWYDSTNSERKIDSSAKTPEQLESLDKNIYSYFCNKSNELDEIGYFVMAQTYLSTRAGIYNAYKDNDIGMKRAKEALKKVIEINPNNWFAINQIIGVLEQLADKQRGVDNKEALDYIDMALDFSPKNTNLLLSKAILLYHLGEKENAVKLIDKIKEDYPDNDGVDFIYRKIHGLE